MGVFMMFGVSLGALAYQVLGIAGAFVFDIVGLTAAALLVRACRISADISLPNGPADWRSIRWSEIRSDFREGFHYIRNFPLLLSLVCGFLLFGLLNGGFAVLPMYTMKYKLAPEHYTFYSSMFAVFVGIGFLLGSLIGPALVNRFKPYRVILVTLLSTGILSSGLIAVDRPWLYLTLVLMIGIMLAPLNIAIGGWLPALVDPRQMGRVTSWNDPLLMLGQSVSLGLIALLYPRVLPLEVFYTALAIILLLVFIFYAFTLPRFERQLVPDAQNETALM